MASLMPSYRCHPASLSRQPVKRQLGHSLRPPTRMCPTITSARPIVKVKVAVVDEASFEEQVLKASQDKTVLVDFWATWCGPCKLVLPLMEWAEKEYKGSLKVVKVEHDGNAKLIEKYKVYGLPTLLLFKEGAEIAGSKREGAVTKAMLTAWLKTHGVESKVAAK